MSFFGVIYEIEHTARLYRCDKCIDCTKYCRPCLVSEVIDIAFWAPPLTRYLPHCRRGVCKSLINKISLFFIRNDYWKKIVIRIKDSTVLPNIKIKTKILVPPFKIKIKQTKTFFLTKCMAKKKKQDKKKLDNEVDCWEKEFNSPITSTCKRA